MSFPSIIITLGPTTLNEAFLLSKEAQNVDLLRINMSHTSIEDLHKLIPFIRRYTNVPICIDTEGAQLRCGMVENNKIWLEKNSMVEISREPIIGNSKQISFCPLGIDSQFIVGDRIRLDFNTAIIEIISIEEKLLAKVINEGFIGSNKAADLDRMIQLPPFTQKDLEAFRLGSFYNIQNYALSFTSNSDDLKQLRKFFDYPISIIAKVESKQALYNLDQILQEADQVLIDRGDLSRQVTIATIPFFQKFIIERGQYYRTPVLVATNLLETMIENSQPTRAEVNDIISTLMSGASGLVLAAETAIGKYPYQTLTLLYTLRDYYLQWRVGANIKDILLFLEN